MPEIFLNYRTDDGQDVATILDRELRGRFGDDHVFLDHRTIAAGADFERALTEGVWGSKVLLCVIGPRWLSVCHDNGMPKIADPDDWIHRELVLAFQHGVHVIPVVDERAEVPLRAQDLPQPLARLAMLQYRTYRHREADASLDRIVADLLALIPGLEDRRSRAPEPPATQRIDNSGQVGANFFGPVRGGTITGINNAGHQ